MPRSSTKWRRRHHRFVARFQLHHRRPREEDAARERAACDISGGDFFSRAPREIDHGIDYLFTSGAQAHAMQIWLEANATPYDPWAEKLESWASSDRRTKEIADLLNGAAATGAIERLRAIPDPVEKLQEIEPGFDRMTAQRAVSILFS